MKQIEANPEHEVTYQELVKLVHIRADKLSSIEVLAIASNMLGKLIAMQDQREYTSEQVMKIVTKNMNLGNQQVIENVMNTKGNA